MTENELALPWTAEVPDLWDNKPADKHPIYVYDANRRLVTDNEGVSYSAESALALRHATRAVNAHDALVAALEEAKRWLAPVGVPAAVKDRIDAALALAKGE
jgi:hypothetical protein